jgi:hypothetical protein
MRLTQKHKQAFARTPSASHAQLAVKALRAPACVLEAEIGMGAKKPKGQNLYKN